jgi:hypothetical protein
MLVCVFKSDLGFPAIVTPTEEVLAAKKDIYELCKSSVPLGKPFKVIDASTLPIEYLQESWVVDENLLNDGVGERLANEPS